MRTNNFLKLVVAIAICEGAGIIGAVFTKPAIAVWYARLIKPAFAPPNWVFAPVWIILFALMGISLYLVWQRNWQVHNVLWEQKRKAWNAWSIRLWTGDWQKQNTIAIFGVQFILNILWSYIFFGLQAPGWAFFELVALWVAIVYTIINFYRVSKAAAWLLVPYLMWVTFAGVLNYAIWMLN